MLISLLKLNFPLRAGNCEGKVMERKTFNTHWGGGNNAHTRGQHANETDMRGWRLWKWIRYPVSKRPAEVCWYPRSSCEGSSKGMSGSSVKDRRDGKRSRSSSSSSEEEERESRKQKAENKSFKVTHGSSSKDNRYRKSFSRESYDEERKQKSKKKRSEASSGSSSGDNEKRKRSKSLTSRSRDRERDRAKTARSPRSYNRGNLSSLKGRTAQSSSRSDSGSSDRSRKRIRKESHGNVEDNIAPSPRNNYRRSRSIPRRTDPDNSDRGSSVSPKEASAEKYATDAKDSQEGDSRADNLEEVPDNEPAYKVDDEFYSGDLMDLNSNVKRKYVSEPKEKLDKKKGKAPLGSGRQRLRNAKKLKTSIELSDMLDDGVSDYECKEDEQGWSNARKRDTRARWNRRKSLSLSPLPLHEREGNKAVVAEFELFAKDRNKAKQTGVTITNNLFRRADGTSLLHYMTKIHGEDFTLDSLVAFDKFNGYLPPADAKEWVRDAVPGNEDYDAIMQ